MQLGEYCSAPCRYCAGDVFAQWLTPPGKKEDGKKVRDMSTFVPRSEEDVEEILAKWERYVHPRARDFFDTPERLREILRLLALGVDRREDMVVAGLHECVYWYGEVTGENPQNAAISMARPGSTEMSATYVNRLLAFIFSTDECFQKLLGMPKEPFRMICGNQLCVNLNHLASDA